MKHIPSRPMTGRKALATMAGASAAFLLSGSAEGAIQTQVANVTLTGDADGEFFVVYMTAGGDVTHSTANSTAAVALSYMTGGNMAAALGAQTNPPSDSILAAGGNYVVGSAGLVARLAAGDMIGSNPFTSLTAGPATITCLALTASTWLSGTTPPVSGYVGFVLANTAWSGGARSFAWAAITINALNQMTVTGYGWETTPLIPTPAGGGGAGGGSVGGGPGGAAGTPEPAAAGLALLALGAAGVMRHKRRRNEQQA